MIKVEINELQYRDAQRTLRSLRQTLPREAVSAMAKTVTRIVQILTDATADVLNLTKGRIKEDISVEIKGAEIEGADLKKFSGKVTSTGVPIGLAQFATNRNTWKPGRDINVRIFRNRSTVQFRHAFIAKGRGASISTKTGDVKVHMWQRARKGGGVFRRGFPYARLPHGYRFPIERLTTVRVQDVQAQPDLIGQVLRDIGEDALKGVREAMNVAISKG